MTGDEETNIKIILDVLYRTRKGLLTNTAAAVNDFNPDQLATMIEGFNQLQEGINLFEKMLTEVTGAEKNIKDFWTEVTKQQRQDPGIYRG